MATAPWLVLFVLCTFLWFQTEVEAQYGFGDPFTPTPSTQLLVGVPGQWYNETELGVDDNPPESYGG